MAVTPDEVCARYSHQSVGLALRLLPADEAGADLVLIEGRPEALRMLAGLLVALADAPVAPGDGFHIDPRGAGSFHFDPSSELGVDIRRLP